MRSVKSSKLKKPFKNLIFSPIIIISKRQRRGGLRPRGQVQLRERTPQAFGSPKEGRRLWPHKIIVLNAKMSKKSDEKVQNLFEMNPEHFNSLYLVGQFLRLQGNYIDREYLIQRVI